MKIYRTNEALREPSLIGQKPFGFIAPMNPQKQRNMLILMFDERNRRISICLPFSLIFPTSLEGYHAGTLKDGAVNCLNERERNVSIKKITQFELINYFSKYLYHRYD